MAVTLVSTVSGNGATLTLNGVTAGNFLLMTDSYFRGTSTGIGEAVPTDTNGTFSTAAADVPVLLTGFDIGVGIFYVQNANAGTHTVTPQANTSHQTALTEYSGMPASGTFVAGSKSSATTTTFNGTTQSTGTTATAASSGDLSVIACALAAIVGSTNVGWTDPVSGYTTLKKSSDDATTVGALQAYQVLGGAGTQFAVFSWTDTEANQASMASIATFVSQTSAAAAYIPPTIIPQYLHGVLTQ